MISRRSFFKKAAAIIAVVAASGLAPSRAFPDLEADLFHPRNVPLIDYVDYIMPHMPPFDVSAEINRLIDLVTQEMMIPRGILERGTEWTV